MRKRRVPRCRRCKGEFAWRYDGTTGRWLMMDTTGAPHACPVAERPARREILPYKDNDEKEERMLL